MAREECTLKALLCLLIVIIESANSPLVYGQNFDPKGSQGLKYGVKFGMNLSSFTGNDIYNRDKKIGILTGIYLEKKLSEGLSFQIEMLYSQKGDKGPVTTEEGTVNTTRKIEYLEMPLLFKLRPSDRYDVNLFFSGGLAPAVKLSDKLIEETSDTAAISTIVNLKKFDVGFVIAWGFDMAIGANRSALEFRVSQSLATIFENEDRFLDIKNSVISILISSNLRKFH